MNPGMQLSLAFAAIMISVLADPAKAVPVQDQSFTSLEYDFAVNTNYSSFTQSFTVGLSGQFSGVDIYFRPELMKRGMATVQILQQPTYTYYDPNNVLASVTIDSSVLTSSGFYHFDFSSAGISVAAGQTLAFSIIPVQPFGWFYVAGSDSNLYAGGALYVGLGLQVCCDLAFKTYVDPSVATTPLPAALPLFASGLGALWFAARRRSGQGLLAGRHGKTAIRRGRRLC